jgi:beta-1,4-mannosyl-glycoprotein beta-1,4-N-acetylglucosaminyltransferase
MRFNIKKLWKVFIIQLILICIFVLFGKTLIANPGDEVLEQLEPINGNVKFVYSKHQELQNVGQKTAARLMDRSRKLIFRHPLNFSDLYFTFNQTISYGNDIDEQFTISRNCFIEGSANLNEKNSQRAFYDGKKNDTKTDKFVDFSGNDTSLALPTTSLRQECECRAEWHGKDCGQPEVIWRAFMKSQQPHKSPKLVKIPHNIFYIINFVSSINLETLEIQMMELIDVVNLFIICELVKSDDPTILLRHQMSQGFLREHQKQILLVKDDSCSTGNIYRKMKKTLGDQMRPQDVLIYSKPDEILNKRALNYFKWYENWPQPVQFRLKYNIYGFFFKHPDNTVIGSIACQLYYLEEFYKSDPDLVLNGGTAEPFIIGDLNHPGGFYCEFCYQPIDIIKQLNLKNSSFNSNIFQRNSVIDIDHVQSLISKGFYIDGKLELIKLRHYHDKKYYMPEYVAKNRWKFDNIVVNLFASWDADLDNDYLF